MSLPHLPARRALGAGLLASTLVAAGLSVLIVAPASAATVLTVSTTTDISGTAGACGNSSITTPPSPLSLREATCLANNIGGAVVITVPAGTYHVDNGELRLGTAAGQSVTLVGAGAASTIIDAGRHSRVLDLDPGTDGGVTTSITGVTIQGGRDDTYGGAGIIGGSATNVDGDQLALDHVVLHDNHANVTSPAMTINPGGAVQFFGGTLTITDSTVDGNSSGSSFGSGVAYLANGAASGEKLTVTRTTFSDNQYANVSSAPLAAAGGALAVAGVAATSFTVTDSTFTGNTATAQAPNTAVGAGIWQQSGTLTVTGTSFTDNTVSGNSSSAGSAIYASAGTLAAHFDLFSGNSGSAVAAPGGADATDDWWGCTDGPGAGGCDTTGAGVLSAPRLVLTGEASPDPITGPNATSTLTASLLTDSGHTTFDGSKFHAFEGLPIAFSDPPGDATVTTAPGAHTATLSNGQASIDYHSNSVSGPSQSVATFGSGSVTIPVTVQQAPAITSASSTTMTMGQHSSLTVTTNGYPLPTITRTGTLPAGVTLVDNGDGTATLAGTPAAGTGGSYPLTLTAANGVSPNATQSFTLHVRQAPGFTSPSTAEFVLGAEGSFTVTTSGFPTVASITKSGTLPDGLTFTDDGDGTATLDGTPTGSTGGAYPVTLTATNGITPDATQTLTIQVDETPAVTTDPEGQTVQPGTSVAFTAAASGFPTPSVQWQRSTDDGGHFSNVGGATSTSYTFTAAASDDQSLYRAVFTNGAGSATSANALLRVGTAPSFTSANHATFTAGATGSFDVVTTGLPDATLAHSGAAFPGWLTLTDHHDGTGTLSGTPPTDGGGTYAFTLSATNGFDPAASQTFTLEVDQAAAISSADNTTFTADSAASFTVTTTAGYPTDTTLAKTGALPTGVTFTDDGDGTATLAGTPTAGTGGTYPLTLTADNSGAASPTTQHFVLTVDEPPAISSADHATFAVGTAASFAVTTTAGYPTDTTLAKTGALPTGVTFTDNGDGTATLAGTPAAGTGGTYALHLTAANGIAPAAAQDFTLTVTDTPSFTSADHTTFTIGDAGSLTITTDGYPPAALTESGALPTGVTFTDNGDGTATLAGTPAAGTAGPYVLTIDGDNGAHQLSQQLTLTVAKRQQSITDESQVPATPVVDGHYNLVATSDSGLPVTFTVVGTACSLSDTTVHFDQVGHCEVDYDQAGDDTYAAAPTVSDSFDVAAIATSTEVVSSVPSAVYGQPTLLTATVSAGATSPAGSVQFTVDGAPFGAPVPLSDGQAQSLQLTDGSGGPLAPGAHPVTATFLPDDPTRYAGSSGSASQAVSQAVTTTTLSVGPSTLRATVAPVSPGAGTPSGTVQFSVAGTPVGQATLSAGVATLSYTVPAGQTRQVAAVYSGDADFTTSSDSLARTDPTLTATLSSAHPENGNGWYRSPVSVTFHCTTPGAALTAPCPAPVVLSQDGAGLTVSRTVQATDGGTATVVVSGIDIDRTAPRLRVTGLSKKAIRRGATPHPRCVAKDALSGVASCTIKRHVSGDVTTYRARATDRAGNVTVVKGRYRTMPISLVGASYSHGAFNVTVGRTYTLVVNATSRPTYYDAAVFPQRPTRRDHAFHAAGRHRWTLGVTMSRLGAHTYWNVGVKIGHTLRVVKIRVHRAH